MRFECEKCNYWAAERTDIRRHVRQAHNDTLGERKGGILPIRRIPTYPNEAEYKPVKTISIAEQMAQKMAATKKRMEDWMRERL